jgi:hypothetical protein
MRSALIHNALFGTARSIPSSISRDLLPSRTRLVEQSHRKRNLRLGLAPLDPDCVASPNSTSALAY